MHKQTSITKRMHKRRSTILVDGWRVSMTVGPHTEGGVRFHRWRDLELHVRRVTTLERYQRAFRRFNAGRLASAGAGGAAGRMPLGPGLYTLTALSQVRPYYGYHN